jgi:glutathione peroxidase
MLLLKNTIMITTILNFYIAALVSFHSLSFTDINNVNRNMSAYANTKKVLIVNIASASANSWQMHELKQLQIQFADSLQIVLFPSNSFGKEPLNDNQIKQWVTSKIGAHNMLLAPKTNVLNHATGSIYGNRNGDMDLTIVHDYEKVLVGKTGEIEAIFASPIKPLDPSVIAAINKVF